MVPIYNHGSTIEKVVEDILEQDKDVLIVDDGCDQKTAHKLLALAEQHENVMLTRHAINQGKGAAFLTGLDYAQLKGYTHTFLVDADGQHNLEDLSHFENKLLKNPDAGVFGVPVFDDSAPAARKFGHKLTNFFINIETGGKVIGDALCGFRLYPISSSLKLMKEANIGRRMEFDPELAVKMAWHGISIINVDTKVVYKEGGISNFRLWADNARISWMHTKLVSLSIFRRFLSKPLSANDAHWTQLKEAGSPMGLEAMRFILKYGGRHLAKFLLFFVVLYFFIFHSKSRQASKQFLEKVQSTAEGKHQLGNGNITLWMLWKHQWEFGASCLDRAICWSGQIDHFDIDWVNYKEVYSKVKEGKGCILLGSHLGNVDILRAYSKQKKFVKLNVFMVKGQSKFFQNIITKLNQQSDIEIIPIEEINVTTSMMLKEKLDKGELIALLGDRITSLEHFSAQEAPFLNENALFPEGPYLLSHLLKCPIYTIFSVRTGPSRYKVNIEKLSDSVELPRQNRKEQLSALLQKYVARLENMAIQHPFQWFNFYNFWTKHN
jgi:predicted LPLAT superfamily acyltransferase